MFFVQEYSDLRGYLPSRYLIKKIFLFGFILIYKKERKVD